MLTYAGSMTERSAIDAAFAPPGEAWHPVSPRLATARRISWFAFWVPLILVGLVIAVFLPDGYRTPVAVGVAAVGIGVGVWTNWLIGRRVRSFGYAERADDLLVTSGIMFRRLVVVPYGRMQLVDITAGPLDRRAGRGHGPAAHRVRRDGRDHPRAAAAGSRRAARPARRTRGAAERRAVSLPADDAGARPVTAANRRQRTHPLSPVIESVRGLGFLIGAMLVFGGQGVWNLARESGGLIGVLVAVTVIAVVAGLILGLFYLKWSRTTYYFDDAGDFHLDSGVISRQERRVALSRLQSVDVVRPLLGRIVGLSQVNLELAGSGDSRVSLAFLSDAQATRLRAEIIARAAGVDPGAGEAPEVVLATVPTNDLIVSLLLRSETFFLLALSVVLVGVAILSEGATGLVLLIFTGGLPLLGIFGQFARFFSFTVADSPDGLRLRHGLASQQSQTVPPGRVQAVEVSQPLLWRRRGMGPGLAQRRGPGERGGADAERAGAAAGGAGSGGRRDPPARAARRRPSPDSTSSRPRRGPAGAPALQHSGLGIAADERDLRRPPRLPDPPDRR